MPFSLVARKARQTSQGLPVNFERAIPKVARTQREERREEERREHVERRGENRASSSRGQRSRLAFRIPHSILSNVINYFPRHSFVRWIIGTAKRSI